MQPSLSKGLKMNAKPTDSIAGQLREKLVNRDATIGIVGMGYVGQPLALRYSQMGYKTLGFDIDHVTVDLLNRGQSRIEHISDAAIAQANAAGMECTTDISRAAEADALILCVPTPLNKYREPDLSFVLKTTDSIVPYLRAGQVISLESTTYPGTTEEELLPRVTSTGLAIGKEIFLVYSPEREDPGNCNFTTNTIPKVVGGHTSACLDVGKALYGQAIDHVVPVSCTTTAEMTKLLENIHRSVNIGLANEMKIVADSMGLDIFEVINAAKTKPFGFTAYYPGPGIGGHCIPVDPFYLTWKSREFGLHTRFIELAGEINAAMPQYVVDKTIQALNSVGRNLNGAKILALGIAYKKDVDDMRESPSVCVMEILRKWGAEVQYSDPNVPVFPEMREHAFDLGSVELTPETLAGFDAVILLTDHSGFDYAAIQKHARIVVDTRGKFEPNLENVWRA